MPLDFQTLGALLADLSNALLNDPQVAIVAFTTLVNTVLLLALVVVIAVPDRKECEAERWDRAYDEGWRYGRAAEVASRLDEGFEAFPGGVSDPDEVPE
jgi:hypothetical protein